MALVEGSHPVVKFQQHLGQHNVSTEDMQKMSVSGLDPLQVLQWITALGPKIMQVVMQVLALLQKPLAKTFKAPAADKMAEIKAHGVSEHAVHAMGAAGIDTDTIIAWIAMFAGKVPQLIQVVMALIAIFKPPTPAPVAP